MFPPHSGEDDPTPVEDITPSLEDGLRSLDDVDVSALFRCRAVVMKSHTRFLRGAFRSVIRFVLQEANVAVAAQDEPRQCRAWVGRTIAKQINPAVEKATAPFQSALTTRAGVECVASVIQTLTDLDHQATVLSVDVVGAIDLISRAAMLEGLRGVEAGDFVLQLVSMFYSSASTYLWGGFVGRVSREHPRRGRRAGRPSDASLLRSGPAQSLGRH